MGNGSYSAIKNNPTIKQEIFHAILGGGKHNGKSLFSEHSVRPHGL